MTGSGITAAAVLLAGTAGGAYLALRETPPAEGFAPAGQVLAAEAEIQSRDIAFYEQRAKADPYGAFDRARLASLYMQRSRRTGDFEDVLRAEALARESIRLLAQRNDGARVTLASSLVSQHRFVEARRVAEERTVMFVRGDRPKPIP